MEGAKLPMKKKIDRRSTLGGVNVEFNPITVLITQGIDVKKTWFDFSGFAPLIASLRIDEKYVTICNFKKFKTGLQVVSETKQNGGVETSKKYAFRIMFLFKEKSACENSQYVLVPKLCVFCPRTVLMEH
jgi:hypothetical protein